MNVYQWNCTVIESAVIILYVILNILGSIIAPIYLH